ncbi:MAG: FAD-dependent oxidoreductase [Actinomyces sp.]|nr:FAD-dependent oxidoreductase [Actinomyces sp.]
MIVVGAGIAGSIAAFTCASAGRSVLVIERGEYAGAKNVTGGRLYAHAFCPVFPDFEKRAPLERLITHEKISMLSTDAATTLDFTSSRLADDGNRSYSVLRAPFDQWLAGQAEEAGAEIVYGVAVTDLVMDGSRVVGVRAGEDEITADVVILADGANTLLVEKAGLGPRPSPSQMAVGVKEIIELPEATVAERMQCAPGEGAAWLFVGEATKGRAGGGFLYSNKASISLGIVATLSSLVEGDTCVPQMLEDFKNHESIAPLIDGGTTVEYSAHLIPEGGMRAMPDLCRDGCLVAGDAAMMCLNLGYQIRGMDLAATAGRLAGMTAAEAVEAGDTSRQVLDSYRDKLSSSFVMRDLAAFQRFPAFMEGWDRMFQTYPRVSRDILLKMFTVDGSPSEHIRSSVAQTLKSEVGYLNLLRDVRGVAKSL